MKIIKNEKLISRNGKIGNWASLAGLVLVIIPIYYYSRALMAQDFADFNYIFLLVMTFAGLAATQIGMYMGNRYGRSPRPDEKLDAGLKGLPGDYSLYHYTTPASHTLVGPAGVWILMPHHQRGRVTFRKNRWQMSGGGFMQSYMRVFGQESIGRPDIEIENETRSLTKHLAKHMDEASIPEIKPVLVFTNDQVELDVQDAPVPAVMLKQLKDFFRQSAREHKLSTERIQAIKAALEQQ